MVHYAVWSFIKQDNDLLTLAEPNQMLHFFGRSNASCRMLLFEGHSDRSFDCFLYSASLLQALGWYNHPHEWPTPSRNTQQPAKSDQHDDMPLLCCTRLPAKDFPLVSIVHSGVHENSKATTNTYSY
jgi:hypothetical protein